MAKVIIPTPLRKFTNNQESFETDKNTVEETIKDLVEQYPDLEQNLLDEKGNLRSFVRVYVGETDINTLEKEQTKVEGDSTISIIPAIAGGNKRQTINE